MKKIIIFLLCSIVSVSFFSQGVQISDSPGSPDNSSILEVKSNSKGFLPPRMTDSERDAIVNPADGLVIFNTTTNCINYMVGGFWHEVCGNCLPAPTPANAGFDQLNLVSTTTTLSANEPSNGTGLWSIMNGSGGSIDDTSDPASDFTGVAGNTYVLRWTITNECGSSFDDVNINFSDPYSPGSQSFSFTGAMQTFTVPNGVSSLEIEVWGAQGGNSGGLGGYAKGNLSVTFGQMLNVYVGGEGAIPTGGFNGGGTGVNSGGGGASDVRTGANLSDRVIVGGGGGGSTNWGSVGGSGGGDNGGTATNSNGYTCSSPTVYGIGGGGGTQTEGGTAGSYFSGSWGGNVGQAGTLGIGGGTDNWNNGGGGGGYYGGGSGGTPGCSGWGAGGGGGSSYTGGVTNGTTSTGVRAGNGLVTITW
ncbi:MAG: hypothetical protein IT223_12805 [Crocinitomicaceae bacterium]|nr:hypothetical protein [Crocinitomicaceae bacterium]